MMFVNTKSNSSPLGFRLAFVVHQEDAMTKQIESAPRHYPALYEKLIPLALALIVIAIVVLLIITFGVVFHLF